MKLTYLVRFTRDTQEKHAGHEEIREVKNVVQFVIDNKYIKCFNKTNGLQAPPIPLHGLFTDVEKITIE